MVTFEAPVERPGRRLDVPASAPSTTWPWLAGFVDGEGTLTFQRIKSPGRAGADKILRFPLVVIPQKNPRPLLAVHRFLHDQGIEVYRRLLVSGQMRIEVRGFDNVAPLVAALHPHLLLKDRHAAILGEFIACRRDAPKESTYDDHCLALSDEIRTLNARSHGSSGRHNALEEVIL